MRTVYTNLARVINMCLNIYILYWEIIWYCWPHNICVIIMLLLLHITNTLSKFGEKWLRRSLTVCHSKYTWSTIKILSQMKISIEKVNRHKKVIFIPSINYIKLILCFVNSSLVYLHLWQLTRWLQFPGADGPLKVALDTENYNEYLIMWTMTLLWAVEFSTLRNH